MPVLAGLDLASKTGFCVVQGDNVLHREVFSYPKTDAHRMDRWNRYGSHVAAVCTKLGVEAVVIESYGFSFNRPSSIIPLVELGSLVRNHLWKQGVTMIEVPPTQLKKFVSGKGNIAKSLMLMEVFKRWDFEGVDDNEADAFALAKMAQALHGLNVGLPKSHLGMIDTIRQDAGLEAA